MKDASYHVKDSKMDLPKSMASFYSRLTASPEYGKIIRATGPKDIAQGNASGIETGSRYKNRTFIWNYGNRIDALKTQFSEGYNLKDIGEALNILNPKIEAKGDVYLKSQLNYLKSQVKSRKAMIRGTKQAQGYYETLANSPEFEGLVKATDVADIINGVHVVSGERKATPYFNSLANRVKAIKLKLSKMDDYDASGIVVGSRREIEYLGQRIEAKGDANLKRELEDIVGYRLGNYEPGQRRAKITDISHLAGSDATTIPGEVAISHKDGNYGLVGKAGLTRTKSIWALALAALAAVSIIGGSEYKLTRQAGSLKTSAESSQQEGKYQKALDRAREAEKEYNETWFFKNNKPFTDLISSIEKDISFVSQAETLVDEANKLQKKGNYKEALERLNEAKELYLQDTSEKNNTQVDSSIIQLQRDIQTQKEIQRVQKETQKGKQNEAALNQLYSDIQGNIQKKDPGAIRGGLETLKELKGSYKPGTGFDGTASYRGDEDAYNHLEKLLKETEAQLRQGLESLTNPKGKIDLEEYRQRLADAKADLATLIVIAAYNGTNASPIATGYQNTVIKIDAASRAMYENNIRRRLIAVSEEPGKANESVAEARKNLKKLKEGYNPGSLDGLLKKVKGAWEKFTSDIDNITSAQLLRGQNRYWQWDVNKEVSELAVETRDKLTPEEAHGLRVAAYDYTVNAFERALSGEGRKPWWKRTVAGIIASPYTLFKSLAHIGINKNFTGDINKVRLGEEELRSGDGTSKSKDIAYAVWDGVKIYLVYKTIDSLTDKPGGGGDGAQAQEPAGEGAPAPAPFGGGGAPSGGGGGGGGGVPPGGGPPPQPPPLGGGQGGGGPGIGGGQ